MINSLNNPDFFTNSEASTLRTLGLWQEGHTTPVKLALAGLMLAPVMQVTMLDSATSASEFQSVEEYLRRIEREFELATKEDLESLGTDMGLLPMVKGTWDTSKFASARSILAGVLERLEEAEAHGIRNAIARGCRDTAQAGGAHLLSVHTIDAQEKPLLHEIVYDLQLESTAEGLHLLGKAGDM